MLNEVTHVDLFSGPGGVCTGFRAAGIKTLLAVEKVKSCVETYQANHPNVHVIHKDIREVSEIDLEFLKNKVDVITSGMPCETFSTAGSKSRSSYDHRQQLYYETIRIAGILKPKIILFENVMGILTKKTTKDGSRLIIDDIHDDLAEAGYKYFIQTILDASDFGVPQSRQRFFILATNDQSINLQIPKSTHDKQTSVSESFAGLPFIDANQNENHTGYTSEESDYSLLMKNNEFWKINNSMGSLLTYHKAPNHRGFVA